MRVSIRGGTVDHGQPSLCLTCRSAVVVQGARLGDQIVACRMLADGRRDVRFPVTSCSAYSDVRHPSLWYLEDIGWVLRSDGRRRAVGFADARDLPDEEKHVIEED